MNAIGEFFKEMIYMVFDLIWGDLFYLPLPGGSSLGISLLVLILIPAGLYFTFKTNFCILTNNLSTINEIEFKSLFKHFLLGVYFGISLQEYYVG